MTTHPEGGTCLRQVLLIKDLDATDGSRIHMDFVREVSLLRPSLKADIRIANAVVCAHPLRGGRRKQTVQGLPDLLRLNLVMAYDRDVVMSYGGHGKRMPWNPEGRADVGEVGIVKCLEYFIVWSDVGPALWRD